VERQTDRYSVIAVFAEKYLSLQIRMSSEFIVELVGLLIQISLDLQVKLKRNPMG
jgi:hypothetical protein